jgi:hypothetical protein
MASLALLVGLMMVWTVASQPARGADGDAGTAAKIGKKDKTSSNRLPPYFGKVVDKQQREKIYAIQNEYRPKIAAARKAMDTLVKEQNDKMLAVLTPEQQKQVQDAAANAKKKKAASASTEPATSAPAASKPAGTASTK